MVRYHIEVTIEQCGKRGSTFPKGHDGLVFDIDAEDQEAAFAEAECRYTAWVKEEYPQATQVANGQLDEHYITGMVELSGNGEPGWRDNCKFDYALREVKDRKYLRSRLRHAVEQFNENARQAGSREIRVGFGGQDAMEDEIYEPADADARIDYELHPAYQGEMAMLEYCDREVTAEMFVGSNPSIKFSLDLGGEYDLPLDDTRRMYNLLSQVSSEGASLLLQPISDEFKPTIWVVAVGLVVPLDYLDGRLLDLALERLISAHSTAETWLKGNEGDDHWERDSFPDDDGPDDEPTPSCSPEGQGVVR